MITQEKKKTIQRYVLKELRKIKRDYHYYNDQDIIDILQSENTELLTKLIITIESKLNIFWQKKYQILFSLDYPNLTESKNEIKQFILNANNIFFDPRNQNNYENSIKLIQEIEKLGPFAEYLTHYAINKKINQLQIKIKKPTNHILLHWQKIVRDKTRKLFLTLKNYIITLKQTNHSNEEVIQLLQKEKNIKFNITPDNIANLDKQLWWSQEDYFEKKEREEKIQNNVVKFITEVQVQKGKFNSYKNSVRKKETVRNTFEYLYQKPTPAIVETLSDEEQNLLFSTPEIDNAITMYQTWAVQYNAQKFYNDLMEAHKMKIYLEKKKYIDLFTKS